MRLSNRNMVWEKERRSGRSVVEKGGSEERKSS